MMIQIPQYCRPSNDRIKLELVELNPRFGAEFDIAQ